jgi:hypothetical protein
MNLGKWYLIIIPLLFQVTANFSLAGSKENAANKDSQTVDSLNMKVMVPAYFDPSGSDYWDRLAAQAALMPGCLYAIANKNNGPDSSYDTAYATAINNMHKNQGKVIGYVYTNYGAIPLATVESDIDKWYSFYPTLDGIFLDCQDNVTGKENYYITIYNYIKQKDSTSLVVSNPGTNTIESYLVYNGKRVSDVVCIFETDPGFDTWTPSAWCSKYSSDNFYVIPYNTTSDQYVGRINRAHSLNVGWIYCTNDALPNPYDTLPPYFEKYCNYIYTGIYTPDSSKSIIKVDGSFTDWQNVTKLNTPPNPTAESGDASDPNADFINFWATNDTSNLYLSYQLAGSISSNYYYHVYIDADDNVNTGYIYNDSASIGAEFMIENDNFWKYTGTGGANWGWAQASGFEKANNGGRSEMSIPLSVLKSANNSIRLIFQDNSSVSPYSLMEIDPADYKTQYYSYKISTVTDVKENNAVSKITTYKVDQNYPNPFNPGTVITYQIPSRSAVSLKIYNILGREVETLVNTVQPAGKYSVTFNSMARGTALSSGVYFYRLQAGNYVETKKMILLK